MNPYEEALQKNIEDGQTPDADGMDVKAYQEVFRVLGKEPEFAVSSNFAAQVAMRLANKQRNQASNDYYWFGAGIFFMILACLVTIVITGFRFDFGFLGLMSDYKGLAVFGIIFILFLHWIDKRVIRGMRNS